MAFVDGSTEVLLRTTTSIGEDFLNALELLAKTDAPIGDFAPVRRFVAQMKSQSEMTGYIGKRGKK